MANCVITKVRYNSAKTHLTEVVVHDEGQTATRIEQRSDVVNTINSKKKTYRTPPPSGGAGADVSVVVIDGTPYLRTDANKTAKDNLGNLPRF